MEFERMVMVLGSLQLHARVALGENQASVEHCRVAGAKNGNSIYGANFHTIRYA